MARRMLIPWGMLPLETIVVPVDFGESSSAAVRYALGLAKTFDANVILVHAVDVPSHAYPSYPLMAMGDIGAAMEAAALQELGAELGRATSEWSKVTTMLRRGKPWSEIIDVAAEENADLIVMGTHGRHGVSHALLGSIAERVVRASSVPVLTVRATRAETPAISASERDAEDIDAYEERISRRNGATIEAATMLGAVAGLTGGALAGPLGALAGGWVGTAVGAVTGVALDDEQSRLRAATAKLDAEVGVVGGDIGAAGPDLPPAKIGAFSAGSAGVAPPPAEGPSEGPMQDLSSDR